MGRSRRRAATRASALFFLLLEHPGDRAALAGLGILHDAVGLPALVVLGQVLGERHPLLGDEEQAVAVLVLLHLLARADPAPKLGLGFFFQAEDGIRDLTVTGVQTCALPI